MSTLSCASSASDSVEPVRSSHDSSASVSARIERLPFSSVHARILATIAGAHFFSAFDSLTIAFTMPLLATEWQLAPHEVALVFATGYVGQAIGAVAFGRAAETYGRRRALRWTLGLLSVLTLCSGLASGPIVFAVLRFLQGLGLGGEMPVGAAYVNELCPARWRGRAVLSLAVVYAVGVLLTGAIAVAVIPALGWRAMFAIGGLPLLLAIFLPRLMPESPRWLSAKARHEEAGKTLGGIERALLASGTVLAEPAILTGPLLEDDAPGGLAALFHGALAARTLMIWMVALCASISGYGLVTWMPTLYTTALRLPLATALLYGLYGTAAGAAGVLAAALLIDRIGRRPLFLGGFGGGAACLACLAITGAQLAPFQIMGLAAAGIGFLSVLLSGIYAYAPELYSIRTRALGTGAASAWERIGAIAGPILVGYILPLGGVRGVFALFGCAALIGTLTILLFGVETLQARRSVSLS